MTKRYIIIVAGCASAVRGIPSNADPAAPWPGHRPSTLRPGVPGAVWRLRDRAAGGAQHCRAAGEQVSWEVRLQCTIIITLFPFLQPGCQSLHRPPSIAGSASPRTASAVALPNYGRGGPLDSFPLELMPIFCADVALLAFGAHAQATSPATFLVAKIQC